MTSLKAWTVVGAVRVDGLRTALGKLEGFRRAGRRAARNFTRRLKNLAKSFTIAWTAAMGAATAATVGFAAKTERQFSELAKLTSETVGAEIGRAIQQMGENLPVARDQLFETAEAALRLGVRGVENVKEFTKVIGQVGVATDIAAGEAAEIMARFAAATETPISKVRNLASVVNELSNTLPRSFSQILQAAQRAGPQLARLGATATDISTISGILTSVSASAQRAGTRLRRLGQELTEGDKVRDVAKGFKAMGVEGFASIVENNPTQAIVMMARAMRRGNVAAQAITQTLSSSSRQALAGLAQRLPRLVEELDKMNKEFEAGTSIQEEFNKFVDDLISQWETMKTTLINVAAGVGENLLPAFKNLVGFIQNNAPQIGVAVAQAMGETLDVILTVIKAVKGNVKAIGAGGLIGFLFFGPTGAAIGGLIAKVINENIALLKKGANDIVTGVGFDKLFDLTTAEQARVQLKQLTTELATLADVREDIKTSDRGAAALDITPSEQMVLENRGIPLRDDQGRFRPAEQVISNIDNEMRNIITRSDELRDNFENLGESSKTAMDGVLARLERIIERLKEMDSEAAEAFQGETGLTREGVTFTGKHRKGAARLAELLAIGERPQVPLAGGPGTPLGIRHLRAQLGLGGLGQSLLPFQFRAKRFRPGRITAAPAASPTQRIQRGTRLGGMIGGTGIQDAGQATGQALIQASKQGMMLSSEEYKKAFINVLDDTKDEGQKRGGQLFRQLGQQLMAGLASGTFDMKDFLKRAFFQVLQVALFNPGGLTSALGISSPATATMFIGESLVEGIAEGVRSQQGSLRRSMRSIKNTALGEMDGIGREATNRVRGISGPTGLPEGAGQAPVQLNVPVEDLPEAENPLEEKYKQKTRDWLERWGRTLKEDGVPEFQPPEGAV